MSQNRPNLIKRFIGIASNTVVHKILIKTELEEDARKYYAKEVERDIDIALEYRDKINPANSMLPDKDAQEIKSKVALKVKTELVKRIQRGYHINLSIIDEEVNKFLEEYDVC